MNFNAGLFKYGKRILKLKIFMLYNIYSLYLLEILSIISKNKKMFNIIAYLLKKIQYFFFLSLCIVVMEYCRTFARNRPYRTRTDR